MSYLEVALTAVIAGSCFSSGQIVVRLLVWRYLFYIAAVFNFGDKPNTPDMRKVNPDAPEFRNLHEVAPHS